MVKKGTPHWFVHSMRKKKVHWLGVALVYTYNESVCWGRGGEQGEVDTGCCKQGSTAVLYIGRGSPVGNECGGFLFTCHTGLHQPPGNISPPIMFLTLHTGWLEHCLVCLPGRERVVEPLTVCDWSYLSKATITVEWAWGSLLIFIIYWVSRGAGRLGWQVTEIAASGWSTEERKSRL